MATGKSKVSRPRAGQGFASSVSSSEMRVKSAKTARNRNRVESAKPPPVARRERSR